MNAYILDNQQRTFNDLRVYWQRQIRIDFWIQEGGIQQIRRDFVASLAQFSCLRSEEEDELAFMGDILSVSEVDQRDYKPPRQLQKNNNVHTRSREKKHGKTMSRIRMRREFYRIS